MIRLFRVFVPTSVVALLLSEVILIYSCYITATYLFLLTDVDAAVFLTEDGGFIRISLVVVVLVAGFYLNDMYTRLRIRSRMMLLQQVCLVLGVAFLSQALLSYADRDWILPHWVMIYGSLFVLVLVPAWRILFSSAVVAAMGAQNVLFLGSSPVLSRIAGHLTTHPELGQIPIGYLDEASDDEEDSMGELPRLGGLEDVKAAVAEQKPDRIVVGMTERRNRLPVQQLLDLLFAGITVEEGAATYEATFGRVCARELRPSQLIFTGALGPHQGSVALQSLYSPLIALVGAVIALPVMGVVAVLVKLSSPGSILLRQRRVGLRGAEFTVFKFRSMYENAEAGTGAVWATRDDPRITPIGRWLRKLRLDELPQLFNVIRGEMSLVGPRPERPEFVRILSEQIPYYRQRHSVKPGITGWAQINHKYGDTIEDTNIKLEYDLYYIKNLSPSLDVYIAFHTFKVMVLSRGAQ
ncbi:MAG: sugar transferase [Bryobacteraceae bacterium]